MIRKDGTLNTVSWEEALAYTAYRLKSYPPSEIGILSSPRVSNEDNYVMMKFARGVLKTNNIDHCERLFHTSTVQPLIESFGYPAMTNSISDIAEADCIFVLGSNVFRQFPLIGRAIIMAQQKGARYICADPRKTFTGSTADLNLQLYNGSDVVLLNGIMQVICKNSWDDDDFIAARTEGYETYYDRIMSPVYNLSHVTKITGVSHEAILQAAEWISSAKACSVIYSTGVTKFGNGDNVIHAIANLQLLTGNLGKKGAGVSPLRGQNNIQGACDMGILPDFFTGYQRVDDPAAHAFFSHEWRFSDGIAGPSRGLDSTEMMERLQNDTGEIKALYVLGENPVLSGTDLAKSREAFSHLEFVVVQDIFLNETAEFADVVFPAVCFAERDGTQTNTERRVQRLQKAQDGLGEAKQDWEILALLAEKMGYAEQFSWKSYGEIFAEMVRMTPIYAGMTYDGLKSPEGMQWPVSEAGSEQLYADRFATANGKARFIHADWTPICETTTPEFPFLLSMGRCIFHWDTGKMTRSSVPTANWIEIHPKDAAELGITEGDTVEIVTKDTVFCGTAWITDEILEKTVFMPSHYVDADSSDLIQNTSLDAAARMQPVRIRKII
jgi:formate dehydrogenase major subunit